MQPIRLLRKTLDTFATQERYIFTPADLRTVFVELSDGAFTALLARAAQTGILERVARGLYIYPRALPQNGLQLFHYAASLRNKEFNYISLETALSDAGVISQIPLQWITIMSSGRTNTVSCGRFGTIEFIHTEKQPNNIANSLIYDKQCRLWRANIDLAIQDMKHTRRNLDLIDWDIADELIRQTR